MKVRALTINDIAYVKELHDKYYSQFEFPNLITCSNAFIIEDNADIILAGFIEPVAEAMLITNKSKSRIKIGRALVEALECARFTCMTQGIQDLYAFVDDDDYAKHLIQHGFIQADRALKFRIP